MQHLDEGTIHAWLDGALTPEEAARVEAHANECPECAGAVAEARGFIAASSRILTALDNAPRGVVPATAPKKRFDPFVWRIAATVLVVAAGTLVVVRSRGTDESAQASRADAALSTTTSHVSESADFTPTPPADAAMKAAARAPAAISLEPKSVPPASIGGNRPLASRGSATQNNQKVAVQDYSAVGAARAVAPAPAPPPTARRSDVAALDRATEPEPLRIIATPRRIGASVTVYEVGGDTITLTESKPLALQSAVVVTGAAATRQAAGKAASEPKRMTPAASTEAPRAISAAPSSQATPPAAIPPQAPVVFSGQPVGTAQAPNVISWSDPATGSTFTLAGKIPPARLEQLKLRIERERAAAAAAAAAAKKNP